MPTSGTALVMPETRASDQRGDGTEGGDRRSRAQWRLARRVLLAASVVALLCLALPKLFLCLVSLMWRTDTYMVVRNKTEATASEIVLRLDDTRRETTEQIGRLAPGEERKLRIDHLHFGAELSLVLGAQRLRFEIVYIDLWAGETYVLELHPGYVLKHGYGARDGTIYASGAAENPK